MDKVWFSGFKYHVNLVCHAQHIFTHLISTQSSVRVSIVTQDFSATNFKIFKWKNRREVFGVSSENILHLTFRGLKMWRKPTPSLYKYNQNFKLNNCAISKIPETSHIFKPLLNAVLYFRNLKDNVTFYCKVRFRLSIVTQTWSVGKV